MTADQKNPFVFTCPHCGVTFPDKSNSRALGDADGNICRDGKLVLYLRTRRCPSCVRSIIHLEWTEEGNPSEIARSQMIFPTSTGRAAVSKYVPDGLKKDYAEACLVLAYSPNASAALSRRCLQNTLRGCAKITPSNLDIEIKDVVSRKELPSYIAGELRLSKTPWQLCCASNAGHSDRRNNRCSTGRS